MSALMKNGYSLHDAPKIAVKMSVNPSTLARDWTHAAAIDMPGVMPPPNPYPGPVSWL